MKKSVTDIRKRKTKEKSFLTPGIRRKKKVIDRESRFISRKIKETIHSLKNPNHTNKISYMLPEIWLPNLR